MGVGAEGKEPAGAGFVLPATLRASLSLHTWQKVAVPSFGPVSDSLVLITNWQPCRSNMMHKIFLVSGIKK